MSLNIKPPSEFVPGDNPALEWKQWLRQFTYFSTAVELEKKTENIQVATFLSIIH